MEVELCRIIAIKADICLALSAAEIKGAETRLSCSTAIGLRVRGIPVNLPGVQRARRDLDCAAVLAARFRAEVDAQECLHGELAVAVWQMTLPVEPGVQAAVVCGRSVCAEVQAHLANLVFLEVLTAFAEAAPCRVAAKRASCAILLSARRCCRKTTTSWKTITSQIRNTLFYERAWLDYVVRLRGVASPR